MAHSENNEHSEHYPDAAWRAPELPRVPRRPREFVSQRPLHERVKNAEKRLTQVRELASRIILRGESISLAAPAVGLNTATARRIVMSSKLYQMVRAEIITKFEEQFPDLNRELKTIELDTAYQGALRRNKIVYTSKDDDLVAKIAADALDRAGINAPKKVDTTVSVVLDAESQALLEKTLRDTGHLTKPISLVKALEGNEFAYALKKPRELLEETSETEKRKAEIAREAKPDPPDDEW